MGDDQLQDNGTASRTGGIWNRIRSFFGGNDRLFTRWSIIRQLGMWDFIWSRGIMQFGVIMALIQIGTQLYHQRPFGETDFLIILAVNAGFAGVIWGSFMWWHMERRYHRMVARIEALRMSHNNVDDPSAYSRHRTSREVPPQ